MLNIILVKTVCYISCNVLLVAINDAIGLYMKRYRRGTITGCAGAAGCHGDRRGDIQPVTQGAGGQWADPWITGRGRDGAGGCLFGQG